jgi:hypothetical protein
MRQEGVVTFTHFTCRPHCALKDRNEENQAVRGLEVGANSAENGRFLASVTVPSHQSLGAVAVAADNSLGD